jgi:hypothetical protein
MVCRVYHVEIAQMAALSFFKGWDQGTCVEVLDQAL